MSRMCQEVTNTLETTTTSCVELGWLGSVSSSNGLHAAGMHSMQLYKCNKCMRLVLGCRVAEHQRKCGPPPLQQQHQNGQRPPKLPVSAPPKSAVPVMRKLPSVPTVLRPQATDTVRQATKLSKVTTTLDPEPEPLVVVVDVDADAIISGKWVSRRARSWNSRCATYTHPLITDPPISRHCLTHGGAHVRLPIQLRIVDDTKQRTTQPSPPHTHVAGPSLYRVVLEAHHCT